MWDAIVGIGPGYGPIIHEGLTASNVIVNNAGPATIRLMGWKDFQSVAQPDFSLVMWPGSTRSVTANLVRVELDEHGPSLPTAPPAFAAVGWRVVP
jgi:hypothetical protein